MSLVSVSSHLSDEVLTSVFLREDIFLSFLSVKRYIIVLLMLKESNQHERLSPGLLSYPLQL